ncbi:MAG: DUF4834 family protein [Winogradskyella sp.]|uniref:DUF4834 family protein n=1 Tax=Winogradskyella sp. TaxID=1883156 RepID=UPI000F3CB6B6|nr:DUF4834 family protein [Winogradskyella sp.]RNC86312.1 MAG: DUF4834 family protein [Winogradskyella sp.]
MSFFLSIVGLARTLLWIVAIYFIVKILSRLLAPFLLRFAAKKMEQRFGGQFNNRNPYQNTNQKEGETVIDKMPSNTNNSNKNVGEYIDYEEID